MEKYDHKKIEKKWQEKWEKEESYKAEDFSKKEKSYLLIEFPYPSGEGLHVGHPRPYIGLDIIARKRRAEGKNVLYPIGWDAFGLPAENHALKTGIHPRENTKKNIDNFKRQIKSLGISFDWSREINTTDPKYYKWTQWIFLQFFKYGLAYKDKMPINWCLSCKIGLANEEVIDGSCERCGGDIEKQNKEQWMLAITKYAERLDKDLETLDYLEPIKLQQRNWIGKSEGVIIKWKVKSGKLKVGEIETFTTRVDTIFGVTYLVLAPEHRLVAEFFANNKSGIMNYKEVNEYLEKANKKTEIERTTEKKEKTGVELKGVKAINPANNEEIPVFIADYVMVQYGTGAIMAVPAHDERDFEFAKKFNLPIKMVVCPHYPAPICPILDEAYIKEGHLVNSGEFDGMESKQAKEKITKFVGGEMKTIYKLRDWVFSRQRYWGEPIPIIFCDKCGTVPVPDDQLPVKLPEIKDYKPTDNGESPLVKAKDWVNVKCPLCGGKAKRETDVMPNWAGSSWYYLRYADPHNDKTFADKKNLKYWTPVDWYNGGMEHTTLHLLYSRFWHKFLYDIKVVPTYEPYQKRTSHGLILAEDGEKMSKSKNNVVNPDEVVERFGADSLRLYEMFMGPFDQSINWSTDNIVGVRRFVEKVWRLQEKVESVKGGLPSRNKVKRGETLKGVDTLLHKTIKKVSEDIELMKFNTAISTMMIFSNELEKQEKISKKVFSTFLILLAPFAPHISEELWEKIKAGTLILKQKVGTSILKESWPKYDSSKIAENKVRIAVQINGKVRATIEISVGESEKSVKEKARSDKNARKWLEGKKIKKILYIKNKIVSIISE